MIFKGLLKKQRTQFFSEGESPTLTSSPSRNVYLEIWVRSNLSLGNWYS